MFSRSSDTSTDAVEFDIVLDAFDRRPGAGEARQAVAVEPVVDQLLHAGRVEDRDHRVDEQEFGGMRDGRGFGHVVVAHQGEHAAMPGRSGEIGVAENVTGAIDAGALAVPDREHAVVLAFAEQFGLLRAPAGGRRKLLVEAGLEDDIRFGELLPGLPQLQVEPAQRRAAIAGDEAGGVQPVPAVALALHQQHADDGLRAGQEDTLFAEVELVVERDVVKRHPVSPQRRARKFARPGVQVEMAPVFPSTLHASNKFSLMWKCAIAVHRCRGRRTKVAGTASLGAAIFRTQGRLAFAAGF